MGHAKIMRFVNNASMMILDISKQTLTYSDHMQQDINSPRVFATWQTLWGSFSPPSDNSAA